MDSFILFFLQFFSFLETWHLDWKNRSRFLVVLGTASTRPAFQVYHQRVVRPDQRRIFFPSGSISQVSLTSTTPFWETIPYFWKCHYFSLKLECEKLASEKIEIQRHYVMVNWLRLQYFFFHFFNLLCIVLLTVLRDVLRPQRRDAQTGTSTDFFFLSLTDE